jgi:uncharacterized protein YndB with AHSA1/START domain
MTNNNLKLQRIYNAPIELVWKAITDREHLKQWYFDFSEDFKLEIDHQFDWTAGPPDGKQWLHRGKMVEIIEGKKLAHIWEYPGYSGTSLVVWELTAIDALTTQLTFTHQFTVPFDPTVEALRKEHFAEGWNYIIHTALKDFLSNIISSPLK